MVAVRGTTTTTTTKRTNVSATAQKQQHQQQQQPTTIQQSIRKKPVIIPKASALVASAAAAVTNANSRPSSAVAAAPRTRKPTAAAAKAAAAKSMPQHVHLLKQQQEQTLTWENKTKPALDAELVRISSVHTSLGVPIPNATGLRQNAAKIEHQHMANACRAILLTWSPMLRKAVNASVNGGFCVFLVPLYIPGFSNIALASIDEVVRVLGPVLKSGGYTIRRETQVQGARTVRISW